MDTEGVLLRCDRLLRKVQEDIEDYKEIIKALNILLVVAAFFIGVQAKSTLKDLNLNLPLSALTRAANFLAFVGLMLTSIGTFSMAVNSVYLQRKVKGLNRTMNHLIQSKVDFKISMKRYINWLENEEKRKGDEQREKASNDHDHGDNGLSVQKNVEDPSGQEPEDISTSQTPEDSLRQLQVEKYDTCYYPVGPASTTPSQARVNISGGRFISSTNNVNSFLDPIENSLEKAGLAAGDQLKLDVRGVHRDNPSDSAQDHSPPPTGHLARVPTQPFNVSALSPGPYNAEATLPIFMFRNIAVPFLFSFSGAVCLAISSILLEAANKGLGPEVWINSTLILVIVAVMVAVLSNYPFRLVFLPVAMFRVTE